MQKIMDFTKRYIGVISIVLALCILLAYSLSSFMVTDDNHRAAEMYIGQLKYTLTIDGTSTNTITVPSGTTKVDVIVTNINRTNTYYKLLYANNSNVEVYYLEEATSNGVKTSYDSPGDSLSIDSTSKIKLKIVNNASTDQTITLKVSGGYGTNTLDDVEVPSGYSEIPKGEDIDSTAKYCNTGGDITSGTEYTDGTYTYVYKKEYAGSFLGWFDLFTQDGWGVILTDKDSTSPVTEAPCTYINDKPVVSYSYLFSGSKATSFELSSFNTSEVTNMSYMFSDTVATSLDVSSFDTSKVTNMSWLFSSAAATEIKGYENFNTSNVTKMTYMFGSSKLNSLNVSNFDTSKVTDMTAMFTYAAATTLDVSNFNTSNVTNMKQMFSNASATTIKGLENFNTSKVTSMEDMFRNTKATTLDVSNFVTSNVTNMNCMFWGSLVTSLDLSSFNTSKVTTMTAMFQSSEVTSIKGLNKFNTSNVTDMSHMFGEIDATSIDVSSFDTSNVTNMNSMFSNTKITTLDLSSFDTSKVTDMDYMFSASSNLTTIYASSKFVTTNVTSSTYMFLLTSSKLVGGNGTKYSASYIDKTYARIDTSSTPGYFTLKTN